MSRNTTAAARRTRCSTASVPISTGAVAVSSSSPGSTAPETSTTSAWRSAATSSRSRSRPVRKRLHAQAPAGGAHQRALFIAAGAAEPPLEWAHRGRTVSALGQLATVRAGQQARPGRFG